MQYVKMQSTNMMNSEFPMLRDLTTERKRTFLFTYMRPKNEKWISQIKDEIEYLKNQQISTHVSTYGAPLEINGNMAANLKVAVGHYEDYLTPDPDILLSEDIPAWLSFDHPDNKNVNHFLRLLMRRDVLSDLGFPSSGRNGPIENIPWETRQHEDEESGKTISYFIAEAPNDPKVFLVRTLWPPKRDGKNFVFTENLLVAKNKESAIIVWQTTLTREVS